MRCVFFVSLVLVACAHRTSGAATNAPLATSCNASRAPAANATFLTNATPAVARTAKSLVLHKTTDAYKTFGGYDVLYKSQTGRWTFDVPTGLKIQSARLVFSMSADDHQTSIDAYKYTIWMDPTQSASFEPGACVL